MSNEGKSSTYLFARVVANNSKELKKFHSSVHIKNWKTRKETLVTGL